MKKYLRETMTLLELPEDGIEAFLKEWDEIKDTKIGEVILEGYEKYKSDDSFNPKLHLDPICKACEECKRSHYPAHALYLFLLAAPLKERYKKLGIFSEDIYLDSMKDVKWKLLKTHNIDGIWGTSFGNWSAGFFKPDIFCIGRLQFELHHLGMNYAGHGFDLNPDTVVINTHIPASGPMPPELCLDSFKKAHEFFRDKFPSGITIFMIESWVMFLKHREFLPSKSNIIKFMDLFEIMATYESEPGSRNEMWRIFGKDADAPVDKLPRDTGLRRAYAEWLEKGGTVGGAYGILFFDGEKILK
ncbi:MAG: hypothetical protein IKV54_03800 [Clostridia bacterium]|nr:hypothetical protein [Clostridia bacterium]